MVKSIQLRHSKPPPYTVEARGYAKVLGETIPRRHPKAKDELILQPEPGVSTVYDILKRGRVNYGNLQAVGTRKHIKTHREVKKVSNSVGETVEKTWTYPELGPYEYMSFNEYEKQACELGAGLRKLGMKAGERLQIFAATSACWLAMAHGCSTQSFPIVTAYDTLGESGLQHSLCQAHAKAIFLDAHLLTNLKNPLKAAKEVGILIWNDQDGTVDEDHMTELKKEHPNLTIHSFSELRKLGESNPVEAVPPKADDLCCIMYTSGSTGPPKGVLLKHSNVVAAIAGVNEIMGPFVGVGDRVLTYLPLAHILEFVLENACLYWGGTMGYSNPRTLTDAMVRNCKGDMREFKPTVMVGVPAVWESVKKGIMAKISASALLYYVFWAAMFVKGFLVATGLPGVGFIDRTFFGKLKEATGGALKLTLSGGGPLAKETQRFISMSICPMINGYGLTETCGMGTLNDPAAWTDSALGSIPASVELKLVDCPELNYYTSTKPAQGELWIRGGAVTEGYLDMDKTQAKDFFDGWFNTGDIGEFGADGMLRIIDRRKNLVKTLNGEYIAVEKVYLFSLTQFLCDGISA